LNQSACQRAEILAGAIAMGEVSDSQRESYRSHLSGCESCVHSLGGERGIERTMAQLQSARDQETWDPDLTRAVRDRMNGRNRALGWSLGAAAACVAASLAIHAFAVGGVAHYVAASTPADNYSPVQPIVLERAAKRERSVVVVAQAQTHMMVVHNVVTLTRPAEPALVPVPGSAHASAQLVRPASVAFHSTGSDAGVPVWRQGGGAVTTAARPIVSDQSATQIGTVSIAPGYAMREAAPVGGENAINPLPAPIAFAQGAEGTTVFEVLVDERGAPSKCTITKSSGYAALDVAVCKAGMAAHYTPRTVAGHAVPGIYDDAFTFRRGEDQGIDKGPL